MKSEAELRSELAEVAHRLWERDLVGASEGNLSVRAGGQRLLCTPSGIPKIQLQPDDMVLIDLDGNPIRRGRPSSEIRLHLRFYRKREDCHAVVHAHPLAATAFACTTEPFPDRFLPEAIVVLGPVGKTAFEMPGSEAVPDSVEPLMADHEVILLGNHGAVTQGVDLAEAYERMETLERVARIALHARQLGAIHDLPESAVRRLREVRFERKPRQ